MGKCYVVTWLHLGGCFVFSAMILTVEVHNINLLTLLLLPNWSDLSLEAAKWRFVNIKYV